MKSEVGNCPVCNDVRPLTKAGRIRSHRRSGFRSGSLGMVRVRCEGTGRKPAKPGDVWRDPL